MGTLIERLKNWKTTLMGSALGMAAAAVIAKLLSDAGCDFSTISWSSFAAFAFTQIMGALATDNGKAVSVALVALLLGACATKYEGVTSDFETFQVGKQCYTVGHGEMKFNTPTPMPWQTCRCDQLILVKRIVVKAGQSPENLSCPGEESKESYQTRQEEPMQVKAMADNYVRAAGDVLSGAFLGTGFGYGMANQQASRMTQSVTGSSVRTSTLVLDGPVPNGVAK